MKSRDAPGPSNQDSPWFLFEELQTVPESFATEMPRGTVDFIYEHTLQVQDHIHRMQSERMLMGLVAEKAASEREPPQSGG